MIVGRILGWLFVLAGLAVLTRDVIGWLDTGRFAPIVLGQLWFDLHSPSLNLVQAVIQRYIHPAVWDWGVTPLLFCWAFAVFLVIGAVLVLLFRSRGRRRRF